MGLHREISLLIPELQEAVKNTLKAFEDENFDVLISETLRDKEVQEAYYAQGRRPLAEVNELRKKAGLWAITEADNAKVITHCDGTIKKSNHQARDERGLGYAIDMVPARRIGDGGTNLTFWWNAPKDVWERMGTIAEENGLDWCYGGKANHWGWDSPHFEILKET